MYREERILFSNARCQNEDWETLTLISIEFYIFLTIAHSQGSVIFSSLCIYIIALNRHPINYSPPTTYSTTDHMHMGISETLLRTSTMPDLTLQNAALLAASLLVLFSIQKVIEFRHKVAAVKAHYGTRNLFWGGSVLGNLLPPLKGIAPGQNFEFRMKHSRTLCSPGSTVIRSMLTMIIFSIRESRLGHHH
jgi:hypothetical protein